MLPASSNDVLGSVDWISLDRIIKDWMNLIRSDWTGLDRISVQLLGLDRKVPSAEPARRPETRQSAFTVME